MIKVDWEIMENNNFIYCNIAGLFLIPFVLIWNILSWYEMIQLIYYYICFLQPFSNMIKDLKIYFSGPISRLFDSFVQSSFGP